LRELQFHHGSEFLEIGAVDRQRERLAEKRIRDLVEIPFQRNNAVLACLSGVADDFLDSGFGMNGLLENTFFKLFAALIKLGRGDVSMTAPRVPPSTIIAAVTWVTSETLPPSITNPPIIPPTATRIPRILAMSGRVDRRLDLPPAFFSAIGPRLSHPERGRRIRC
jgi:hypothetical protein